MTDTSTISSKLESYIQVLDTMDDMKDRYTWLMEFGKKSGMIPERFKLKEFEVPGCQSQTWLIPHFTYEDTIYFIITALNKLNIDWMRNKILLKVLPLKV